MMGFSNQAIRAFLQSFYASTILATVCSLPTMMTTPSTLATSALPPTVRPPTLPSTVRPPTLSPTVNPPSTTTPFTDEDALIEEIITDLTLPARSVSALGNEESQERPTSDLNNKDKSKSTEDNDDEKEDEIQICEMPENRDPFKQPPKIALYQSQINKIVAAREELKQLKDNRTLLNANSDLKIVNLTTDQINQFLPFYRGFFRVPGKEVSHGDDSLRNRRAVVARVCPALTHLAKPELAITSEGTIAQIIQFRVINQVFFEEQCEFSTSPLDPTVNCTQSTRQVRAVVIDLNTFTIGEQDIEIQSCVGVKYF